MSKRIVILTATIGAAWAATAVALPPRNVNPTVNKQEYLQSCVATCQAHSKTPAVCSNQCRKAFTPFFGPPTGVDTSTYNVVSCDVSAGAIWAWYAVCKVELGLFTDGVTDALSSLINSVTAAKALMGAAGGFADPCGYVRDQVLAQTANRCPASPLLPKMTTPPPPR